MYKISQANYCGCVYSYASLKECNCKYQELYCCSKSARCHITLSVVPINREDGNVFTFNFRVAESNTPPIVCAGMCTVPIDKGRIQIYTESMQETILHLAIKNNADLCIIDPGPSFAKKCVKNILDRFKQSKIEVIYIKTNEAFTFAQNDLLRKAKEEDNNYIFREDDVSIPLENIPIEPNSMLHHIDTFYYSIFDLVIYCQKIELYDYYAQIDAWWESYPSYEWILHDNYTDIELHTTHPFFGNICDMVMSYQHAVDELISATATGVAEMPSYILK